MMISKEYAELFGYIRTVDRKVELVQHQTLVKIAELAERLGDLETLVANLAGRLEWLEGRDSVDCRKFDHTGTEVRPLDDPEARYANKEHVKGLENRMDNYAKKVDRIVASDDQYQEELGDLAKRVQGLETAASICRGVADVEAADRLAALEQHRTDTVADLDALSRRVARLEPEDQYAQWEVDLLWGQKDVHAAIRRGVADAEAGRVRELNVEDLHEYVTALTATNAELEKELAARVAEIEALCADVAAKDAALAKRRRQVAKLKEDRASTAKAEHPDLWDTWGDRWEWVGRGYRDTTSGSTCDCSACCVPTREALEGDYGPLTTEAPNAA